MTKQEFEAEVEKRVKIREKLIWKLVASVIILIIVLMAVNQVMTKQLQKERAIGVALGFGQTVDIIMETNSVPLLINESGNMTIKFIPLEMICGCGG